MREWYLIYCKARQEDAAACGLEEQGYSVYFPKLAARQWRAGNLIEVVRPLFPRYVFISPADASQSVGPAQYTRGVQKLVRFGSVLMSVPDAVVSALRAREDPKTGYHLPANVEPKAGDRVRIASGVLEGIEAVFEARTGNDRVVILLDFLGRQTRTEVSIKELEQ